MYIIYKIFLILMFFKLIKPSSLNKQNIKILILILFSGLILVFKL